MEDLRKLDIDRGTVALIGENYVREDGIYEEYKHYGKREVCKWLLECENVPVESLSEKEFEERFIETFPNQLGESVKTFEDISYSHIRDVITIVQMKNDFEKVGLFERPPSSLGSR